MTKYLLCKEKTQMHLFAKPSRQCHGWNTILKTALKKKWEDGNKSPGYCNVTKRGLYRSGTIKALPNVPRPNCGFVRTSINTAYYAFWKVRLEATLPHPLTDISSAFIIEFLVAFGLEINDVIFRPQKIRKDDLY